MSMASSGHFAQKSQHWRKIHIDQWDEGWRGGGVEGSQQLTLTCTLEVQQRESLGLFQGKTNRS